MNKILIDTNVILDIALKREPYYKKSSELIRVIERKQIPSFITATTITDIYYIAKKTKSHETAIEFIKNLLQLIDIAGVEKQIILNALNSDIKDFEDAIQENAAKEYNIEIIITRNEGDFVNSSLTIYSPEKYLETLQN